MEAYDPSRVSRRYRIEQRWIDDGCLDTAELVDLGRGLFMRSFSLDEGLGNQLAPLGGTLAGPRPRPNLRRFQKGHFGGPDATACVNCHWKGGLASGGDRADNAYLFGDGDDLRSHDVRNPPALWGAGWVELIAGEMTAELQAQTQRMKAVAVASDSVVTELLVAKGTDFGTVTAIPTGTGDAVLDMSAVVGVDDDLIVKPFGWKGVFRDLRSFVAGSAHFHLNLQSEELVAGTLVVPDLLLGEGPPDDPDGDGIRREFTEGQLTSLVLFLALLDTPVVRVPEEGGLIRDPLYADIEIVNAHQFTARWFEGANTFTNLGCSGCHRPIMELSSSSYATTATISRTTYQVDLGSEAARPRPERDVNGVWLVPVFSDFKRHRMGSYLEAQHVERGVARDEYLTRRLWGVANTKPYMHDGSATTFDEAIALHAGEGSEARWAADSFFALSEAEKGSLRVFLLSLRRAPAIRIR